MAKVSGNPKISGVFGEAVFVQIDGQTYLRGRAKTSKEVIHTAPSREGQRQTMSEFGKSSQCAKLIREAWRIGDQSAAGPGTSGRLTKVMQQIMDSQPGKKGMRSILLTQFGHKLIGFEHDNGRSPISHFNQMPRITQTCDPSNLIVTLELPPNTRHMRKKAHPRATHYALEISVVILADMHTPEDKKGLEYTGSQFRPEIRNVSSDKIPIGKNPGTLGNITTTISLPNSTEAIALISWGVQYYTCQDGIYHCIRIEKPRSTVPQHDTYMVVHAAQSIHSRSQGDQTGQQELHTQSKASPKVMTGKAIPISPTDSPSDSRSDSPSDSPSHSPTHSHSHSPTSQARSPRLAGGRRTGRRKAQPHKVTSQRCRRYASGNRHRPASTPAIGVPPQYIPDIGRKRKSTYFRTLQPLTINH